MLQLSGFYCKPKQSIVLLFAQMREDLQPSTACLRRHPEPFQQLFMKARLRRESRGLDSKTRVITVPRTLSLFGAVVLMPLVLTTLEKTTFLDACSLLDGM